MEKCAQPSRLAYRDAVHCYTALTMLGSAVMLYKEMAESDKLHCGKNFQRLSSALEKQGWTETAAELLEAFTGWVKRTDAMEDDVSDASTKLSENMADLDSE